MHELIGKHSTILAADGGHVDAAIRRRLEGVAGRPGLMRCLRRNETTFDAKVLAGRIEREGAPAVLATLLDVTEFQEARRSAERHGDNLARIEALCRSGSFEIEFPVPAPAETLE